MSPDNGITRSSKGRSRSNGRAGDPRARAVHEPQVLRRWAVQDPMTLFELSALRMSRWKRRRAWTISSAGGVLRWSHIACVRAGSSCGFTAGDCDLGSGGARTN
jgi:hypothetical protein